MKKNDFDAYKIYIKTSAIGLEVGLYIIIGSLLGYFFDKKYHTSPFGLIFGVLIGGIGAIKTLWKFAKDYLKKNDIDKDKRNPK